MCRCFATKTNVMSLPARRRRSPLCLNRWRTWLALFQGVTLRLELGDLLLQDRDLSQLGALLAVARKCRCWCLGCFSHPTPQNALGQIQVPARLGDRNASLGH